MRVAIAGSGAMGCRFGAALAEGGHEVLLFTKATMTASVAAACTGAKCGPAASGNHLASTLQDLLAGRPTEIAFLNGAVASRALAHGLAAPANTLITQLAKHLEATHARRVTSVHS